MTLLYNYYYDIIFIVLQYIPKNTFYELKAELSNLHINSFYRFSNSFLNVIYLPVIKGAFIDSIFFWHIQRITIVGIISEIEKFFIINKYLLLNPIY